MNHDTPSSDAAREREWLAQERALRAERLGLDPHGDDALVRRYRLVAKALRQPPAESLPADFAGQVAARTRRSPRFATPRPSHLDMLLFAGLAGVFAIATVVAVVPYGPTWLPAARLTLPMPAPQAIRWPLAFAACLGLSWLLGKLKPVPPS